MVTNARNIGKVFEFNRCAHQTTYHLETVNNSGLLCGQQHHFPRTITVLGAL
jgi:hypothetical protein